jgi:hypothetical protein
MVSELFKALMAEKLEKAENLLKHLQADKEELYGLYEQNDDDPHLSQLNLIILHTELLRNEIRDLTNKIQK